MLDWISKKRRDKKRKEAREKTLKKSLAEKVLKYDNHIGESKNDFTNITIDGKKLRVAKEQITLTAVHSGSASADSYTVKRAGSRWERANFVKE